MAPVFLGGTIGEGVRDGIVVDSSPPCSTELMDSLIVSFSFFGAVYGSVTICFFEKMLW